ncbi:hypothetical protein B7P43_G00970, partial [Cryptotermes secundus]
QKTPTPVPFSSCIGPSWLLQNRPYSVKQITKNIELISAHNDIQIDKSSPLHLTHPKIGENNTPLVVMLSWLMAKKKHILKYANFYIDQGFDVLSVSITPWQLLWPVKGTQVVAGDVLRFLYLNGCYQQCLLHGFSVGGYLWAEVMVKMSHNQERYQPVIDRIVGHIWDSAVDITEIPVGFPRAVFPNNTVLQATVEKYIRYHMKTFRDAATVHYEVASRTFHSTLLRSPALMLFSKTDPIGTEESNRKAYENWEKLGLKTYVKCWDQSPHVGHFHKHPKEYLAELYAFLDRLGLVAYPEKIQAKL